VALARPAATLLEPGRRRSTLALESGSEYSKAALVALVALVVVVVVVGASLEWWTLYRQWLHSIRHMQGRRRAR
jgi:hypothetical protein